MIVGLVKRPREERQDDYLVLDYDEWLVNGTAEFKAEIARLKPVGLTPSGRWAVKHVLLGFVLAGVLIGVAAFVWPFIPALRM